jgi:hypothetical protein
MKEIRFLENGFEMIFDNYTKTFIAYQSIVGVSDVTVAINYTDYSILYGIYYGKNVCKYSKFIISLNDGSHVDVYLNTGMRYFRRLDSSLIGWKYLGALILGKLKNGLDKQSREWLNNKFIDMYESVNELKLFRSEFINKFNEWKIK